MRALELLSLTIADPKNRKRLKELIGIQVALIDYFYGDNEFKSTDESWEQYFEYYAYAAVAEKQKRPSA